MSLMIVGTLMDVMAAHHNGTITPGQAFLNFLKSFLDFHFTVLPWYSYIAYTIASVICVLFAGLMSGLTLGLLSFDTMTLMLNINSGTEPDVSRSKRILCMVKHHHWLLVTLLMSNSLAMEALPLFLDGMVPSGVAIILSVTCILLFGEIIPQAVCSRFGLCIGAFWPTWILVWALMIITFPISFPLAKLLDCLLGKNHSTFFRRAQLSELVNLHRAVGFDDVDGDGKSNKKKKKHGSGPVEPLSIDEVSVIRGALDLNSKTVSTPGIMTRFHKVFMLGYEEDLDEDTIEEIKTRGHSRIPIFKGSRQRVVGLLIAKRLIGISAKDGLGIRDLKLTKIPAVASDFSVWDMLNIFQTGRSHMALVYQNEAQAFYEDSSDMGRRIVGIVTLEEIIEEILQEEIYDEADSDRLLQSQAAKHALASGAYRSIQMSSIRRQTARNDVDVIRPKKKKRRRPVTMVDSDGDVEIADEQSRLLSLNSTPLDEM